MDESVALDSSKQKDFVKSVRGIKRLLKKQDKKSVVRADNKEKQEDEKEAKQTKRKNRGLVYLSHIPHGFYEQQMTEYFKQFGVVTNARVIRSKHTGNSKGFAFVEFKQPAVAQVVAETMNNYLMGKRLLKAVYIPPHKQKRNALRKHWNRQCNPGADARLKYKKQHNADKSVDEDLKNADKLLSNLLKTKKKLKDLGIEYDFFKPVDVPDVLKDKIDEVISKDMKPKEIKNEVKDTKIEDKVKKEIKTENKSSLEFKKGKKQKNKATIISTIKDNTIKENPIKENKKSDKKATLKKASKKEPENFISIKESGDSDSSVDFDSDEFDKMIESDDDDDISNNELTSDNEDESESDVGKLLKIVPIATKKGKKTEDLKPEKKGKDNTKTKLEKRKSISSGGTVPLKKGKFEKQKGMKAVNKIMKKRK